MDIRHLRYFVAVAEELHFTRAAARLGIRQPPLSLQIKQLEAEIGAPLFRRLSRGVELTEAGRLFLDEARAILSRLDYALVDARRRARGECGRIRMGFAGATYFQPLIPAAIRAYRTRHPDVVLSPEQSNTPALITGLHEGRIDVAFIRPPIEPDARLRVLDLIDEEMVIAVPAGHPLDTGAPLPLAALATEPFILFPREIGHGLHDSIIAACLAAGFTPKLGQDAPQISSIIPMVAAGFGVSVVPRSVTQIHADGIVYRPIADAAPRAPISLAWRSDDRSVAVGNFITAVRKLAPLGTPRSRKGQGSAPDPQ